MSKSKTFRHVVLCHTDDFPSNKNDKIKGWVESHGGIFSKTLTLDVTHFVASKRAWKKYPPIVREARRQKNTKVVSLDWLEDSLLSSTRRPKDTKLYEWDHISAKKKIKEDKQAIEKDKQIERALLQHEIAVTAFESETGYYAAPAGYHLYTDSTLFTYSITLVRTDILSNRNQFHKLKLYETDAIPHRYMVLNRYTKPGETATTELSPLGSQYDIAFDAFKKFFKLKTNVEWEARLEKRDQCCYSNSTGDGGCNSHFRYQPPEPGKPKGAMKQSTLANASEKKGNGKRESSGEVTVLMPSVAVEDDEIECCTRTPQGD